MMVQMRVVMLMLAVSWGVCCICGVTLGICFFSDVDHEQALEIIRVFPKIYGICSDSK